jgi:VWFA-related protein
MVFALVISAAGGLASSQTGPVNSANNPSTPAVAAYCERLAAGKGEPAALQAVCEFALGLRGRLPNVIGDEDRIRYQDDERGNAAQRDRITAKVRYEDGEEQYSQITMNGKPVQAAVLESSGAWWEGEFARDLRAVFLPQSAAEFRFVKRGLLHSTEVLIFDFRVAKANNRFWYLKVKQGDTETYPGYSGRLWINKLTLSLLRLERKADDIDASFPIQQASTAIDYGDVDLADGSKFVLPTHAVDIMCPKVTSNPCWPNSCETTSPGHCWHNQLDFKHWHKFAAKTRILTGEEEPLAQPPVQPPAEPTQGAPPAVVSGDLEMDVRRGVGIARGILNAQTAEIERERESEAAAAARIEASKVPPPREPVAQRPAPVAPGTSAKNDLPDEQVPIFKASVRLVLVPTVVRDSHGHTVDTLQKTNFQLFDERRPQLITQFALESYGSEHAGSGESGAREPVPATPVPATRHAAYVFDDIHASQDDLLRARDAARRHLASLRPGDRAAVFALSGQVVLDFTNDTAKVNEALQRIRPHPLTATGSVRCPDISYVQADLIENQRDAMALEAATADALHCAFGGDKGADSIRHARALAETTAAQVLVAGRAESQVSFNLLREIVRGISQMPGQRTIVLVSPGFPVAEMQQAEMEIIDNALRAGVIINVVDPSGLSSNSAIESGSASTVSDVLVDLASGSGGIFFHNRNDMDEGFQKTALPDNFYVLGFSPSKPDGKFHKLKVTLQGPEKLSVQARRGYYAPKPQN